MQQLLSGRYGYRVSDGAYVPDDVEQAVIARLRGLRASGRSWDEVAAALNAVGTIEPPAGTLWKAAVVEDIHLREFGTLDE